LCQFLPQDRVSEFAGLNPIELLHGTQRAAAPEEMLQWHDELKDLRREQKALQLQHETDQESLGVEEQRQENLRGDVERLQERAQIQEKLVLLEKSVPFVEYRIARKQHMEHRKRKAEAQSRLRDLETQVEPTLRAVNAKQEYQNQVDVVVKERRETVKDSERAADAIVTNIAAVENALNELEQTRTAELDGDRQRKQDFLAIQRKISDLEARLSNPPPEFDPISWNVKIVSESIF
jgi:chromosome segregation ATPase